MRNVKMHYDGWLQLPAGVRSKLALETKDELEITLADDGVLLRPAGAKMTPVPRHEPEVSAPPAPKAQPAAVEPRAGAMRARAGRSLALPAGPRPRGRRKTAAH
jgi:bifunctional DNA-binding transcriptional regulator/antitoxin component of YhaV-PrlF toxin-antitoxin module